MHILKIEIFNILNVFQKEVLKRNMSSAPVRRGTKGEEESKGLVEKRDSKEDCCPGCTCPGSVAARQAASLTRAEEEAEKALQEVLRKTALEAKDESVAVAMVRAQESTAEDDALSEALALSVAQQQELDAYSYALDEAVARSYEGKP